MSLVVAAAVVSIGSSILGAAGGIMGNKRAAKAAQRQADLTFSQRQEEIRRTSSEYKSAVSYDRAAVYASNLQMSGTPQLAVDQLEGEFARDIAWRRNAAELEKSAIKAGAPGSGADLAILGQAGMNIGSAMLGFAGKGG